MTAEFRLPIDTVVSRAIFPGSRRVPGMTAVDTAAHEHHDTAPPRVGWWEMLRRRPSIAGMAFGLFFWWESLSPTLMPRTAVAQAMISAVCIGAGIVVGTVVGWCINRIMRRFSWTLGPGARRGMLLGLIAAASCVVVLGLIVWPNWQNDQRDLMGMEHISATALIPMVLATLVLSVIVIWLGRIVWRGVRAVDRWVSRHFQRTGAVISTIVIVAVIANVTLSWAFNAFDSWARDTFGDLEFGEEVVADQPQESTVSGSPDSLISWDTLGREGRNFVTQATPEADLTAFHGDDVLRPIRIYAGLKSADDAEGRAELAVDDLRRAGGFDREVLVVTTVTGTGWVDPDAATAIEQLYAGDTAMIAIQYSFLPSWISTLVDADVAQEAGSELFNAVSAAWLALPEDERPKLLVFGQSLGSLGAEAAFAGHDARTSVANVVNRTDGALFTGPTNSNAMWQQIVEARDEGSTAWLPVYRGGESVRFANRNEELLGIGDGWQGTRVLYIQHPSDPVTFWNMPTMWSEPDWIKDPKGYDIPDRASWFPFVTWAQGVGDLAAGFGAKPGFGHDYSISFVHGWAAVSPPEGWTDADTLRLQEFLGKA
jgi:uncharacterized membrane protein